MILTFTIPVEPVAKARPRFTRTGHAYTPKTTADFEALVAACARKAVKEAGWRTATAPQTITVYAAFFYTPPKSWTKAQKLKCLRDGMAIKHTKPDVDNLLKAVLDGMNGIVFADDALIGRCTGLKAWSYAKGGSIELTISSDENLYEKA